jgi:NAD(P)-dependent dehydrogenase (short-subunit alcohol dehydrogenase family)
MSERKTAFVTGGSSGLGFELAKQLGENGFTVVINGRNIERLEAARKSLAESGLDVRSVAGDISSPEDMEAAAAYLKDEFGTIDFLVLNAGVVSVGLLGDFTSYDALKQDLEVDLWGSVLTAYLMVPLLNEGSRMLMVSSGFGLMGTAGYTTYCAAKAGIINFAEALRRELIPRKIKVQVAIPGDMDTPQFHGEMAAQPEWMKSDAPRGMMKPDEAARKILAKCRSRSGRPFLVTNNFEVTSLILMGKLLPRMLRDMVLDSMFPIPPF